MVSVKLRAHHMADRVYEAQSLQEGYPRQTSTHLHTAASSQVIWLCNRGRQVTTDQCECFKGDAVTHRVKIGHAVGLNRMHHRVDARPGSERRWQTHSNFRIKQGQCGFQIRVPYAEFHPALDVGHHGSALCLGTGAGRRRDANQRGESMTRWQIGSLAVKIKLPDRAVVVGCQRCRFTPIHTATPADGNHAVMPALAIALARPFNVRAKRVG